MPPDPLSDKTARDHHSGQCLAATLHWVQTFGNTI